MLEDEKRVRADSGDSLKRMLNQEDHRYVFTLIQKFHTEHGERYPVLSTRSDIIVITDEAHRSQYDIFASNMRSALPNAAFIGFTGTPLMAGEERTKEVFGDYVSIYNFKESVDDQNTVPLYYENRIPELQLTNDNLTEDIAEICDHAELDDDQERKLEQEFAREYHLITRDDRLDRIGEDIVAHFMGRGVLAKAMVISIDKATAVRTFDKVQKHWKIAIAKLRKELAAADPMDKPELEKRLKFFEETDMAVVVSSAQNEIEEFKKKGLDIATHRKRMVKEDLETKFKNPDDPLRIVFVCAMWITGFDVPSCSTIYLDKPMKNHTLMQTIARANRVWRDKQNGLIVDYVGVFRNLAKGAGDLRNRTGRRAPAVSPVHKKEELVSQLREAISATTVFCVERGVNPATIQEARGFERVKLLEDAVAAFVVNDDTRRSYLSRAGYVDGLFKSVLPDTAANEFGPVCKVFRVIAEKIRSEIPAVDIAEVMAAIEALLDQSIGAEGYVMPPVADQGRYIDLSQIDFEALREKFEGSRKPIEVQKLRAKLTFKLARMIQVNRTRIDFLEEFQKMIDEYNNGAINVQVFFDKLLVFATTFGRRRKTWYCRTVDGRRTGDLRSPHEAGRIAHAARNGGGEKGCEGAPGEAEEREAGARLAEAANDPGDGVHNYQGRVWTNFLGRTQRNFMKRSAMQSTSTSTSRIWVRERACTQRTELREARGCSKGITKCGEPHHEPAKGQDGPTTWERKAQTREEVGEERGARRGRVVGWGVFRSCSAT